MRLVTWYLWSGAIHLPCRSDMESASFGLRFSNVA